MTLMDCVAPPSKFYGERRNPPVTSRCGSPLLLLTCALLMTSSHSVGWIYDLNVNEWREIETLTTGMWLRVDSPLCYSRPEPYCDLVTILRPHRSTAPYL